MCTLIQKTTVVFGVLALTLPATAAAQRMAQEATTPRTLIYAYGGGLSPLTELDDAGTTKFKTGFAVGAGIGIDISSVVGLRGDFNWSQARVEEAAAFAGEQFDKFYYGGEVVLQHLPSSGFTPYIGIGAGAVTIKAKDETVLPSFTKFAGRSSVGLKYMAPSGFSIFGQATGWVYQWDRGGFDKLQVDLQYVAGVSFSRFGW